MTGPPNMFRFGTRGSPLALTQAAMVRAALIKAHGWSDDVIGVLAIEEAGMIILRAEILSEDGSERRQGVAKFDHEDGDVPGRLAAELLTAAPPALAALFSCAS